MADLGSNRDRERSDNELADTGTAADEIVVDGRMVGIGPIDNPGDDVVDSPELDAEIQGDSAKGGA